MVCPAMPPPFFLSQLVPPGLGFPAPHLFGCRLRTPVKASADATGYLTGWFSGPIEADTLAIASCVQSKEGKCCTDG